MGDQKLKSFLGLTREHSEYHASDIVLLPIPFDKTSSYLKGADRGPAALIAASNQVELYDIETGGEIYKKGIHTAEPILDDDSEQMVAAAKQRVTKYIKDEKFVVSIGGEHSISEGPILAHAAEYSNMSVLQLDAHTDLRESYEGSVYNHACIMNRIRQNVSNTVAVGIRSMDRSEIVKLDPDNTFLAQSIHDSYEWVEGVVNRLTPNVYVTIDLDVFDPAYMPSTGTPEPGGLNWYQVTALLRRVAESRTIVGADIVELCPNPSNVAPDFMAAKLLYKLLSYRFR